MSSHYRDQVERVKENTDIVEVIRRRIPLDQHNRALCPFHKEKSPSFCVNAAEQFFFCFGCQAGGDVFTFVMMFERKSFNDVLTELAGEAGIPLTIYSPQERVSVEEERSVQGVLTDTVRFYHRHLTRQTKMYLVKKRGLSEATIKRHQIGFAKGGLNKHLLDRCKYPLSLCLKAGVLRKNKKGVTSDFFYNRIVIANHRRGRVVHLSGRSPDGTEPKYIHMPGQIAHLYNEDSLTADEVWLCEGAVDVLTLLEAGIPSVGIYGAAGFKKEWVTRFSKVKRVFVALHPDEPGNKGSLRAAELLGERVRVVVLPQTDQGNDLNDLFVNRCKSNVGEFKKLIEQLKTKALSVVDFREKLEPVNAVHLMDVNNANYCGRKVCTDVMVTSIGETYHVPKLVQMTCLKKDTKTWHCRHRSECPLGNGEPQEVPIASNNPVLIDFTRSSESRIGALLKRISPCKLSQKIMNLEFQVLEHVSVQELLSAPKANRIQAADESGKELVDDVGKEYREKLVYFLGTLTKSNRYYRAVGRVIPSPKGQEASLLVAEMSPIAHDHEDFLLTQEVKNGFALLQPVPGQPIDDKMSQIAKDLSSNITQIYGEHREKACAAILLCFHSVLGFRFDGERLKRGWVEILVLGDTGEGKTQLVDRIMSSTGLGESIDGVSSRRTGISFSYQQYGNKAWFLSWGKYPLNDGRLLFVDEAQKLSRTDVDNIRKGRSEGVITADGVKKGEHPTRTRLICACNPKSEGVVDDHMFGIEIVKEIFRDEDVRRFDLAIVLSGSDQSEDVVNKLAGERKLVPQRVTPRILHDSVCWAWTRRPEDVLFTEKATKEVIRAAKSLYRKFGQARDIPLISTDIRHKLARLSVALATLVHSTDESHEKVIVEDVHVRWVEQFLLEIYGHPNCAFDLYAKIGGEEANLSDQAYLAFLGDLEKSPSSNEIKERLLKTFISHNRGISRTDLSEELAITREYTSKVVGLLRNHRLIRVRRGRNGGYQPTPKFVKLLKRLIKDGTLNP